MCRESAPVLRMIVTPDQKGLWLSTTESSVKWWNLSGIDYSSSTSSYHDPKSSELRTEVKKPEFVIPGGPSIKQCEILNDKRHILTKDTDNSVALYDVLKARKVEDLGQVDYDQEKEKRSQVSLFLLIIFKICIKTILNHMRNLYVLLCYKFDQLYFTKYLNLKRLFEASKIISVVNFWLLSWTHLSLDKTSQMLSTMF